MADTVSRTRPPRHRRPDAARGHRAARRRWAGRGRRDGERGAVSAELVVATPLLLLLILAVVQFALWQHATHVAQTIAQQGLAAARVAGGDAATGRAQAGAVYSQLGRGLLLEPTITATATATTAQVTITGTSTSVVPFLHLPVRAVAVGPRERFIPATDVPAGAPAGGP